MAATMFSALPLRTFTPNPKTWQDKSAISSGGKYAYRWNGFEDIGGMHPSRRRQYVYCFDHTDIFMFAASLSHYDQPVVGCASSSNITSMNRLAAAGDEFAYFLNRKVPSRRLHQPILMLKERDVFAANIQHKSLSEQPQFSDF